MQWCCPVFENAYYEVGRRGLSLVFDRTDKGTPIVLLQHRAVAFGREIAVRAQVELALVSDIAIRYCPWCGCDIHVFYRQVFDLLVKKGYRVNALSSRDAILNSDETRREGRGESGTETNPNDTAEPKREEEGGKDGEK